MSLVSYSYASDKYFPFSYHISFGLLDFNERNKSLGSKIPFNTFSFISKEFLLLTAVLHLNFPQIRAISKI